jgi:Mn2+/Fe2+ NRAMP family transporter
MGPRFALVALLGAFAVTGLLVMAELSGVAFALQLATSIHYLLWVPVAAVLVLLVIWLLPFETMEKIYGLLGLTMLVFVVAVWHLAPDWTRMCSSATTPRPVEGESWPVYLFVLVTLIGAR